MGTNLPVPEKDRSVQHGAGVVAESNVRGEARERVLEAAYALFTRRAVRDVGVDELVARAGVAKATLYRYFPSKEDVVEAVLARREERWTAGFVEREARRRGSTPEQRLLAIFDVFGEWFERDDFEACLFINVLLEMGKDHRLGRSSIRYLENIRYMVARLADEAGLVDVDEFARAWHILMKGSIIAAREGDHGAASRARRMASLLIDAHGQPTAPRDSAPRSPGTRGPRLEDHD